jgi:hypothetical protein
MSALPVGGGTGEANVARSSAAYSLEMATRVA